MQEKKSIELIILEVLGCLDSDDRYDFQSRKQTDENFPWKALGEFQNLSALLPSILNISEFPSAAAKERMINILSHSLSTESSHYQPAKFVPAMEKKHEDNEQLEEILTKNKIDWGELSVSNQSQLPVSGYEEVMPKAPTIKRDLTKFDDTVESAKDLKPGTSSDEESTKEKEINTTSSSKLKRYVMVSIILFIISLTLFGYLFIFNQSNTKETLVENKPEDKLVSAPIEEFVYNNIQDLENIQQTADVQQAETETNSDATSETNIESISKEDKKNNLPKAPPKLPESIEAPIIETTQISTTEEAKNEEEINVPPPKEEIEETQELTYFIAVEEMPELIGGLKGIQEKIVYPEFAKRAGVQGKVYIRAFVDEKGNVTNAEVVKGIGGGCDEAALDAVLKTKFSPGKQRGKPVKVQVTIPILFKL